MAHSKRNTSRSVFTSHERDLAKAAWTSTSARLNRDSFLTFGSCYLCLEIARDPVSCSHGDIFCRECAVANLLSQKKKIKRLERTREKAEREILEAHARQDAEAQERAVKEFEMIQAGLTPSSSNAKAVSASFSPSSASALAVAEVDDNPSIANMGTKRKFILDQEELARIASEDRIKARKSLDDEKASKESLPSFWTPSQTPDAEAARKVAGMLKSTKLNPTCPASPEASPHPYSLKTLIPICFKEEADPKTNGTRRVCPSCLKTLGNASRPQLSEKCGHVICRSCAVKFMASAKDRGDTPGENACYVCDARLTADVKQKHQKQEFAGLIELRSEGTGFSARGANKVEKSGVAAFQC